jgi:GntR family transcriptional regulator/MocR family aminotransferase
MGVAAFISEGHLARHVRKMRQLYRERRQLLLARLQEDFAEWLDPIPSFYGMHVAVAARGSLNLDPLAESLLTRNVKIHTFSRYYLGPSTRSGLIFGLGAAEPAALKQGLLSLHKAWSAARPGRLKSNKEL